MNASRSPVLRRALAAGAALCAAALSLCGSASGATTSFRATADGYVSPAGSVVSHGRASRLRVQTRPARQAYLRFPVTRLPAPVTRARLWLYAWSSGDGLRVHTLRSGRNWDERRVRSHGAPRLGALVGEARSVRRRHWVVVDVTGAVRANGGRHLAVTAVGARPMLLGSRETRMAPRLEVVTAVAVPKAPPALGRQPLDAPGLSAPPPAAGPPQVDTRSPSAPASLSVTRATGSAIDLSWPAATDDVGVTGYRYYLDGVAAGSTDSTATTITGLACGATYELAVDAVDAAGNRSARRTTLGATRVCPPVPANVFVAPGGDDGGACTKQAPCLTFDRGYRAARSGEVVEIAGGSYPQQRMTADDTKSGADAVTVRPAAGEAVVVADLEIDGASAVTFKDLTIADTIWVTNADPDVLGSHDVTFDSVTAQTFRFAGRIARIAVRGGTYGATVDGQPQVKKYDFADADDASPQAVLIDGATFRDFRASRQGVHTECLQLLHASVVTVRNSRFDRCDGTGAIGVTNGPVDHLTIENNFLGKAGDAYFAVQLTRNSSDVVVRNNSMSKGMIFSDQESGGPWLFEGNYMPFNASLCTAGATHLHNVYAGGACSSTDLEVDALQFVDEDGFDLHLAPGSAAIDRGNPASFPPADIDGDSRPMGGAPDAGADELR